MDNPNVIGMLSLFVNITLPVVLVFIGWRINKSIKELEHSHWANQKIIEKRLQLFDQIAPRLNDLYCFYLFIGRWKEISPMDLVQIKRELDRLVYTYRAILGVELTETYRNFMDKVAFHVYNKAGENARIIGEIENRLGDRRIHAAYDWQDEWQQVFYADRTFDRDIFVAEFFKLMQVFQSSLGLGGA